MLRRKERDQVEVYDVIAYRLQRCLTVPNSRGFDDMTSCEHYFCIFFSERIVDCIHRLDAQGAATQWAVKDEPCGLSVNAQHKVLVACNVARKIKQSTMLVQRTCSISAPGDIVKSWHTIQTRPGQLIVSLYVTVTLSMISADGRHIVQSHGRQPAGSDTGQYDVPARLAVYGSSG